MQTLIASRHQLWFPACLPRSQVEMYHWHIDDPSSSTGRWPPPEDADRCWTGKGRLNPGATWSACGLTSVPLPNKHTLIVTLSGRTKKTGKSTDHCPETAPHKSIKIALIVQTPHWGSVNYVIIIFCQVKKWRMEEKHFSAVIKKLQLWLCVFYIAESVLMQCPTVYYEMELGI